MTEPYNDYTKCWDRVMRGYSKLNGGYRKGVGAFLPKVCILPYPNKVCCLTVVYFLS